MNFLRFTSTMVFLAFFILNSLPVHAASLRCGSKLVKTGDSQATVRQRCGAPDQTSTRTKRIRIDGINREERLQVWSYNRSSGKHNRLIFFHEGQLIDVELIRQY